MQLILHIPSIYSLIYFATHADSYIGYYYWTSRLICDLIKINYTEWCNSFHWKKELAVHGCTRSMFCEQDEKTTSYNFQIYKEL